MPRFGLAPVLNCFEPRLSIAEYRPDAFDVPWPLGQRLMVPFAARFIGREEVAAVDVYGARHLANRVEHGMYRVPAERRHVAHAQRTGPSWIDLRLRTAPENVVFSTG